MSAQAPFDQARASVLVKVDRAEAFRFFTEEIDRWWQRGPQFRPQGQDGGIIFLEPHAGGRVFESSRSEGTETVFEIGRTLVWEPPERLVFSWRARNFTGSEQTRVEVVFAARRGGTEVTVTHSGWSMIAAGHPVRHGLSGPAFVRSNGLWWGQLLSGLRELLADREP